MSNNGLISRAPLMAVPNVRKVTEYDEAGYGISYNAVPLEAIENAPSVDVVPKDFHERCMDNLVNELLTALDAAPKWISVQDRLPNQHRADYIVRYVFPHGNMAFFGVMRWNTCGGNGYVDGPHFDNEGMHGMHVTHWMPLPEPPEELKEESE